MAKCILALVAIELLLFACCAFAIWYFVEPGSLAKLDDMETWLGDILGIVGVVTAIALSAIAAGVYILGKNFKPDSEDAYIN